MRRPVVLAWIFTLASAPLAAQQQLGALTSIERPQDLGSGTLALAWHGEMLAAPQLQADYEIDVGGVLARAHLRQTFENTTGEWLEGVYVFPLPDGAQVDRLELVVGGRRIAAVIREREQARAQYAQARSQGQRAGLLESDRPNLFTTSVANIGPGERVTVEIAWQQSVRYDEGSFTLRLPLVVGPRYVPHEQAAREPLDARRISPIVRSAQPDGHTAAPVNAVHIAVRLDAGMPLSDVRSRYHEVIQTLLSSTSREITLAGASVPADRDFVLEWRAAAAQPTTALFTEHLQGGDYSLLQFFPPQGLRAPQLARDIVLVIDTSGSMDGTSIEQARQALLFALGRLTPADRFNIIRFASDTQLLHPGLVAASPDQLQRATRYVHGLTSGGGTEMYHAVNAALRQFDDLPSERVRQVVFMTDGNIGNEEALFDLIRTLLGNARLYTVGIGSAPNGYFMASAARYGRGTHTFIADVGEVAERMTALFDKIAAPVLTDIEIEWPDGGAREVYPQRLTDLFAGEPMLVAIRGTLPETITMRGRMAGSPWSQQLSGASAAQQPGIGRYWAGQRIANLLETRHRREPGDPIYDAVVDTALTHNVVSRYTSLVAIEDAAARAPGEALRAAAVPIDLPAGWQASGIGTRLPATATSARFSIALGLSLLLGALAMWLIGRRTLCHA